MFVAIVLNAVSPRAGPEDRDLLVQADAVEGALRRLGHRTIRLTATLDLAALRRRILRWRPGAVFNLVEELDGSGSLIHLVPSLVESLAVHRTGSSAAALLLTSHKIWAKRILLGGGLPTPPWLESGGERLSGARAGRPESFIVKAVWEHASFGLDDGMVARMISPARLRARIASAARRFGREMFAEGYIPGREFNVSLLAVPSGVEILPLAEIDFSAFPRGKPRIVGYRAKWEERSFEFSHTPRRFDFPSADRPLLARLRRAARDCWDLFGLSGYARVDFRADGRGRVWILEVNANPCLAPDGGFAFAAGRSGRSYDETVRAILAAARKKL
jgi:D-alanine-D-alanine ligase